MAHGVCALERSSFSYDYTLLQEERILKFILTVQPTQHDNVGHFKSLIEWYSNITQLWQNLL